MPPPNVLPASSRYCAHVNVRQRVDELRGWVGVCVRECARVCVGAVETEGERESVRGVRECVG